MTVLVIRRLPGKQDREYPYRVLIDGRQRAEVGDDATVQIGLTPGEHRVSLRVKWCGSRELTVHNRARRDCAHAMPPQCQAPAGAPVHYALAKRLHCPGNGEILDPMTSAEPLAIARELILRPGGLDDARLDHALAQVMSSSVDSADLYFQLSREESWALEDGIVKEGSASIEQGVGVRAVAGEKTGFAYSDEIVLPALEEASRAARAIAVRGSDRAVQSVLPTQRPQSLSTHRSGQQLHLERKGGVARARRSRDAQDGSARQAGHGERRRRARGRAGRQQRRASRRRRAPAGALQRLRHRRAGRAPRAGLRGRRRPHHAARARRGRQAAARWRAKPCARRW